MHFELRKKFTFEASHQLMLHDGKCARLHGHSFNMYLVLRGYNLVEVGPKTGMLIDYGDVSKIVKPYVEEYLDHHHLNDTLKSSNPTSELIAKLIYERFKPEIPLLHSVLIDETCTSSCAYIG